MTVVVNGEERTVSDATTLADLARDLGRDPQVPGTAIARNGEVVPRRVWAATELAPGDAVEILTAVGGG